MNSRKKTYPSVKAAFSAYSRGSQLKQAAALLAWSQLSTEEKKSTCPIATKEFCDAVEKLEKEIGGHLRSPRRPK